MTLHLDFKVTSIARKPFSSFSVGAFKSSVAGMTYTAEEAGQTRAFEAEK